MGHFVSYDIELMPLPIEELNDQNFALDQSAIVSQTDAKGIITRANDRFCEISGYARSELIGKPHAILNSGVHPKLFFQEMWRTISTGQIWQGEICNRKKDGELYWVATTITPFLGSDGRPHQYMSIRQDITALKNAQETILNQQAQLVNASRLSAIGEMATAITHEINNPLAVILGRAEMIQALLAKGPIDGEVLSRLVDTILVTGKRIEKIVRSMKSLSRSGNDEDPFLTTSVNEIVSDSVELCAQRFRNHGIELKVVSPNQSLNIDCRSHQVVQVLVNLLNNAFDAIQGLSKKWVELLVEENGDHIDFVVTDSGAGISLEVQNKLFQPFFSTKRVQYGTGLGLSISRSIIERHEGKLFYDPESTNTRFVVRLPRRHIDIRPKISPRGRVSAANVSGFGVRPLDLN